MEEDPNRPAMQLEYAARGADPSGGLEVNARNLARFLASALLASVALTAGCWAFFFAAFFVRMPVVVVGAVPILLICAALWIGWVIATSLKSPAVFFGVVAACWALLLAANFYGLMPLHSW